ncbi:hypothetical protein S7711_08472 [Stachybotrys chartarum IBT 7711]|uniref:CBM1 domain-containing protein n=1 Tax=Stachybotrys chartarum (strain CBS 109288 / IBT 7711) TaxID=1280523 RepID=A0A084AGI5_STACB|nr:hypothetical protein S7711_08472 [Stachybotrys chartarum IBT 7711]
MLRFFPKSFAMRHNLFVVAAVAGALPAVTANCHGPFPMPLCKDIKIEDTSIDTLQQWMTSGELTSQDLVECYLARIEQTNDYLHSISEVNPDALEIAAQLDEERAAGGIRGPLHGIPFLVKDNIYTDDKHNTSEGTLVLLGGRYSSEATVALKMRAAGGVLLGHSTMSEAADHRATVNYASGYSSRTGQTRNPYNFTQSTAGSSSGSAVAVRSNQVAVALGTETYGSLVHPSAQLGLYTIKSTPGLMSRHGIVTGSYWHDTPGPLARSMKDVSILLDIMVGTDRYDNLTFQAIGHEPEGNYASEIVGREALRGMKLGLLWNPYWSTGASNPALKAIVSPYGAGHPDTIAPEFNHAIAFNTLLAVGYGEWLQNWTFPADDERYGMSTLAEMAEWNDAHNDTTGSLGNGTWWWDTTSGQSFYDAGVATNGTLGAAFWTAFGWGRLTARQAIDSAHAVTLDNGTVVQLDGLLMPNGRNGNRGNACAPLPSYAGYPVASVPVGVDAYSTPFGMCVYGKYFGEAKLVKVASAMEDLFRWHERPLYHGYDTAEGPWELLYPGIISVALAQSPAYGQCGGLGWTGPTTCVSGYCCIVGNEWYSQCVPGTCTGNPPGTTVTTSTRASTSTSGGVAPTQSFTNPVLWEDLADNDVFRVGSDYYYTSSTMHYSPGAPVLHSRDLVNWEYVGHAVPTLDWGSKYNLNGARAYVNGIWASTMRYRRSNGLYYWLGCIDFGSTYIYTSTSPSGPWRLGGRINTCYYDAGMLIDDDDTIYVAYGNSQISVARLSADGFSQVSTQQVFTTPSSIGTLEGARFYKRNGQYYIFMTRPANGQYIIKSSSPQSGYGSANQVLLNMRSPVSGSGIPHQGSLVDTPNGDWYYMAFIDSYPGGRIPVLAPITWTSDGWPTIQTVGGAWGANYRYPVTPVSLGSTTGRDTFTGTSLGPQWEWNHNPDTSRFTVNNGLTLSAATVTNDLYWARNTLTKRIHGPQGVGTLELDFSRMADGDRAGLALFRDRSAWVGIARSGSSYSVQYVTGLNLGTGNGWPTQGTGTVSASQSISATRVWLRIRADISPGTGKTATFHWSTNGSTFSQIGGAFTMNSDWQFFMGYRYGIFEYATRALGGSVNVISFTSE